MLKHVNNTATATLGRRPSKPESDEPPPSPTPSTSSSSSGFNIPSCMSLSPILSRVSSTVIGEDVDSQSITSSTADSAISSASSTTTFDSNSNTNTLRAHTNRSCSLDESTTAVKGLGIGIGSSTTTSTTWRRKQMRKASLGSNFGSTKLERVEQGTILSNASSIIDLHEYSIPLRVYANCLRPDIQYKTVGINQNTTCEEVIDSIFKKCKLAFKDPKLFSMSMEMKIRGANGLDMDAMIPLEPNSCPSQLLECYPNGQAKFSVQMSTKGSLIKVYDDVGVLGCEYKGVMISDKTTAGELINILVRFSSITVPTVPSASPKTTTTDSGTTGAGPQEQNTTVSEDCPQYELHVEVDGEWSQKLDSSDMIIPMQTIAKQFGNTTKLILKTFRRKSTIESESIPTNTDGDEVVVQALCPSPRTSLYKKRIQQHGRQGSTSSSSSANHMRNRNRQTLQFQLQSDQFKCKCNLPSSTATAIPASSHCESPPQRHSVPTMLPISVSDEDEEIPATRHNIEYWRRRRSLHSLSSSSDSSQKSCTSTNEDTTMPTTTVACDDPEHPSFMARRSKRVGLGRRNRVMSSTEVATATDDGILLSRFRRLGIGGLNDIDNRVFFASERHEMNSEALV